MTEHQVVCVSTGFGTYPYSRIMSLRAGGIDWTPHNMALHIALGLANFYTIDPVSGIRAEVEPRRTPAGKWYVTTRPDPVTGNNLENLVACAAGIY